MLRIVMDCNDSKFDEKFTNDGEIKDCLSGRYAPEGLVEACKETMEYLINGKMSGSGYLLGDYGCNITRDRKFCTDEALDLFGDIVIVKYLTNEYVSVRNLLANGVIESANDLFDNLNKIEFNEYIFSDYRFNYIGLKGLSEDKKSITVIGFDYYKNDNLVCVYDTINNYEIPCVVLSKSEYIHPAFRETTKQVLWVNIKDFEPKYLKPPKPNYINKAGGELC